MAVTLIDLTTPQPGGKFGDPTKTAWEKANDNFEELDQRVLVAESGSVLTKMKAGEPITGDPEFAQVRLLYSDTDAALIALNENLQALSDRDAYLLADSARRTSRVDNIAELRALPVPSVAAASVLVAGYFSALDGGGGLFVWSPASNAVDDGGSVISPSTSTGSGRWLAVFENNVYPAARFGMRPGDLDSYGPQNKAALDACIAAMPSMPYGSSGLGYSGEVILPFGIVRTTGQHVVPSDKTCTIRAAGKYNTLIRLNPGSTGDFITANARNVTLRDFAFDGNRNNCPNAGDAYVFNRSYGQTSQIFTENLNGRGLVLGKAGASLGGRFSGMDFRNVKDYALHVVAGSGSTDNVFETWWVGQTGKSGMYVATGAQSFTDIHVWQTGLESLTDRAGLWLNAGSCKVIACEFETCNGDGILVTGSGSRANIIVGNKIWGNAKAGVHLQTATFTKVSDNLIYSNGVSNLSGGVVANAVDVTCAGIFNEGGTRAGITDNIIYDRAATVPTPSYSVTQPTYPFPGRPSAVITQTFAYAENSNADGCLIMGNIGRGADHASGLGKISSGTGSDATGRNNVYGVNDWGDEPNALANTSSVSGIQTIRIPSGTPGRMADVVDAASIQRVLGLAAGQVGWLRFTHPNTRGITASDYLKINSGASTYAPGPGQIVEFKAFLSNGSLLVQAMV